MVDNLQAAFDRLTEKYIHRLSSSDEEIAVEYQLPTPSRKHKLKLSESPVRHKRKKKKSHSETDEAKSSVPHSKQEEEVEEVKKEEPELEEEIEVKKSKDSHKSRHDKSKKKRKGHHRHGKHSKNHKKNSHKSNHKSKRHSKNTKHGKNKDKEGKKSKQRKKKSKHHDNEPVDVLKRSVSQESLESSNRSRSASPLPSIHTPSPSPTEIDKPEEKDQLPDSDFLKDKYDKIKERSRHAAKDAWESLFDYKQKTDKQKQNVTVPEKDKNQKLRETIEKLKAKNEKYKDTALFNSLFTPGGSDNGSSSKEYKESSKDDETEFSEDDTIESVKEKPVRKKGRKSSAKNASASEALEQAVKDISKWLDDAPKGSLVSSPCDSPAQTISTEEQDNSRFDDESSQGEKSAFSRKELSRKRPSSREPKILKRREIQRTIDRLQPGKSKGNLLTNISNKNLEKAEDVAPLGPLNKTRELNKAEESSPKLSLGSVLPTVEFTLGNDHNFNNEESKNDFRNEIIKVSDLKEVEKAEKPVDNKNEEKVVHPTKKDAEVETDPQTITKPSQEKATPNLSAWFKAFGAPKTTNTSTSTKKKVEETENEEKSTDTVNCDTKTTSPKNSATKYDSPNDLNSPLPDGGDSPLPSVNATPRQRRTSTGSSVSERSSFSQDLDSPRHQMSHTSPLLRSPASPRTDDFQKITYPIINGTVRAGFYQDTTSLKSSPEKSCSPRDAPQSPYSSYSQHVYASNSNAGSATPNYFIDQNKSPLPTYGQNAPPFYDTSKAPSVSKPPRVHDDYTALGPDTFQQNHFNGPFSPTPAPYPTTQSNYSQPQISPQPSMTVSQPVNTVQILPDPKTTLFPVKKRTYNEPETPVPAKIQPENKEIMESSSVKTDYAKSATLHVVPNTPLTSVDDIALALSEKSELLKLNTLQEKNNTLDYSERLVSDTRDNVSFNNNDMSQENKKEIHNIDLTKSVKNTKNDDIDMINMGYLNAEDRKSGLESQDVEFVPRENKSNLTQQQKGYEIEAIAINLGINQQFSKPLNKPPISASNTTPAHTHAHERMHIEINNQNIPHAHLNQYDSLPPGQPINTFSLNDIEAANKKLYACNNNISPTALDYGNWKINQIRKPDVLPSDYSANTYASNNEEKLKSADTQISSAINYNKTVQHQQFSNYNSVNRSSNLRNQDMQQSLPAELRIPNPRGLLKADTNSASTSVGDCDTLTKNMETISKSQKNEKLVQSHPLVSTLPYKTPYSTHSTLPIETLRNLPNIPQMLERYANDERYLSSFANSSSSLYHDKTFQMAQIFNKNMVSEALPASTSVSIYSQPTVAATSKDNSVYKSTVNIASTSIDSSKKSKRKRTSVEHMKPAPGQLGQNYHTSTCNNDILTSVKTNMMPASPFNFGTTANMALSGMYGDNSGFTIEDFRNSTNQLMAANYMAAAVAHQQRSTEANAEKLAKPAHQNSSHGTNTFPFIGHSQVRAGYPFVGGESSSPLYQQYWQRYQEELQRQRGAQIMSLYPSAYTTPLGVRQPYDSINRPSWL